MWFSQISRSTRYCLALGVVLCFPLSARSQAIGGAAEASPTALNELAEQQKQLAEQFLKLEELFIRLSELEAGSNPTRAGLLQQAARLSKEQATSQRLAAAAQLLDQKQYSRAIQEQQAARETLAKLLELLQSENRRERIREERDRIQALLKDVRRIERMQKSLRGRTENGAELMQSMQDQQKIESQTAELEQKLAEEFQKSMPQPDSKESDSSPQNSGKNSPSKDQPNDASESAKSPRSSEDNESDSTDDSPSQRGQQTPPTDQQQNNSGEKTDRTSEPRNSDAQPSPNSESSESNSGEEAAEEESEKSGTPEQETQRRVKAAQKRMQAAQKELEKAQREQAVEEQRQAEKELAKAIEDLERILRQLREEEVERSLADLESRFRKMLAIQVAVLEETVKLQELTGDARDRQFEVGANRLAGEERKILVDGQRAMLLLREEGSSEAFPQILEQILLDVDTVASSLTRGDLSANTVDIERDIITALEELIEALNRTRKERETNSRRNQQQSGGQPSGDDPLVDALSELKLVKTLQQRINQRTAALAKRIDDPNQEIGQARTEELKVQLRDLAVRQQKIKEVTRALLLKAQEQP